MREQVEAIVKDSGVFVGGVVRDLNGEGRFDMRGMETPFCKLMALLSPPLRNFQRGLRRRREHATVHRNLPDNRILIAWVYTTLIVVQQDLRNGDGVPFSLPGCPCDYSEEEVLVACLAGDVGGRDVRIGVGQAQLIPSAELPHLIARSDATCALVVLASDDQAVRQRKPLKQTREHVRQVSVFTDEFATAVDWRRLSSSSDWKLRARDKAAGAKDPGLGHQLAKPEESTAAKESELPPAKDKGFGEQLVGPEASTAAKESEPPSVTDDPTSTKRRRIVGKTAPQVAEAPKTHPHTTQVADAPRSTHAPERPLPRSLGPSCRPVVHRAWLGTESIDELTTMSWASFAPEHEQVVWCDVEPVGCAAIANLQTRPANLILEHAARVTCVERNEQLLMLLALDAYGGWACCNNVHFLGRALPDLSDATLVVSTSEDSSRRRFIDTHVVGGAAGLPLWAKALRRVRSGADLADVISTEVLLVSEQPRLMRAKQSHLMEMVRCCPLASWLLVAEPRLDQIKVEIADKSSAMVMYKSSWPEQVYSMALECAREIRASSRAQPENVALCARIHRQSSVRVILVRSQESMMHIVGSSGVSMQIVGLALQALDCLPERACRLIFDHAGGVGDPRAACALICYCLPQTAAASRGDRNMARMQSRIVRMFLPHLDDQLCFNDVLCKLISIM